MAIKKMEDDAPAPQAQIVEAPLEDRPILIPQIAGFLTWVEELITTSAGLLLSLVLVVTLASLLTGGTLLKDNAILAGCYAWAQGIGIEGQLTGMTFRAIRQCRNNRWPAGIALFLVVTILACVSFVGAAVVNHQETFGTTTIQALGSIGVSKWLWDIIRAGVLILLVVISAAMRYAQPLTLAQKEAKIREDMRLKALRQESMQQSVMGFAAMGKAAFNQVKTTESKANDSTDDTTTITEDKDAVLPEERPRIEPHLVALSWHDKDAQWWDKAALIAWALDEYSTTITEAKANTFLQESSKDEQGRPARIASQGNPYTANKDDVMAYTKKMLRLKKAPRNTKTKTADNVVPFDGNRAANG